MKESTKETLESIGEVMIGLFMVICFLGFIALWAIAGAESNEALVRSKGLHKNISMPYFYNGNEIRCNECHDQKTYDEFWEEIRILKH